jgi:hypothetical protein
MLRRNRLSYRIPKAPGFGVNRTNLRGVQAYV